MADDRVEKRMNRQRGAWREHAREVKGGDFSFNIAGTPSTVGRRSKTPSITPAVALTRRRQSRSASRGITRNAEAGPSHQKNDASASASRPNRFRSTPKAQVTPTQLSNKRKQPERPDDNIDELSVMDLSKRKSRKSSLGIRISVPPAGEVEEDELNHDSPEHLAQALSSSGSKRSHKTPSQASSASRPTTGRRNMGDRPRIPLSDIDENSVAFLPSNNDVASDDERPIIKKNKRVSTSEQRSRQNDVPIIHPHIATNPPSPVVEDQEEDELANVTDSRAENASLAQNKHNRAPVRPVVRSNKPKQVRKAKSQAVKSSGPKELIPICVYRRSRKPQADSDPFGSVSLPSLSASDALRQCLEELCRIYIERYNDRASARTIIAWKDFKNAIQDSLFDVQIAQNSVHALAGRLRQVKRIQGDKQAELMQVKRRREEMLLQMDSVRRLHIQRSKEEDGRRHLAGDLKALQEAMAAYQAVSDDPGQDEADTDPTRVEYLLQDVKALVGNEGILHSVLRGNASMEGALQRL